MFCLNRRSRRAIVHAIIGGMVLVPCATAAGWEAVQRISPGKEVRVETAASKIRGRFVRADISTLIIRSQTTEQSFAIKDVRRVRVADPSRRVRMGLIGMTAGLGAGIGIGFAVCPSCANEGAGGRYIGPAAAAGAGAGALGFLSALWRTVYLNAP